MIIGFQSAGGAGFGAAARIDGQAGFGADPGAAAAPLGFFAALAQAAPNAAPAPVAGQGNGGESAAGPDDGAAEAANGEAPPVDAAAADAAAEVAANAPGPIDAAAAEGADAAPVPMPPGPAAEEHAAPAAPVDPRRAVAAPELAAALARAAVAPAATAWQPGQSRAAGGAETAAATAAAVSGGGTFALPEALRPQLPAPVVRGGEAPSLPAADASAQLPLAGASRSVPTVPEWSPVKVDAAQAHWGRELMAALAERVEMQVTQQIKQARIRLDPPELGRLQLTVRLDSDRLSVQLNASQPQVREVLAQQLDRLRADLAGQFGERVDVAVGQEQRQQRQPGGDAGDGYWPQGIADGLDLQEPTAEGAELPRWQGWVNALA